MLDSSSGITRTPPKKYWILGLYGKVSTQTGVINHRCQEKLFPSRDLSDANLVWYILRYSLKENFYPPWPLMHLSIQPTGFVGSICPEVSPRGELLQDLLQFEAYHFPHTSPGPSIYPQFTGDTSDTSLWQCSPLLEALLMCLEGLQMTWH